MRLIGAGLPRTATTTQYMALERLGLTPCYHMRDLMGHLEHALGPWERVIAGDPDWDAIFGEAQASVDFPAARYWRELADHYPQAKVLLSVRDGESWVRSMRETVWGIYYGDSVLHHASAARAAVDPLWNRFIRLMTHMTWAEGSGAMAGDTASDEGFAAIMQRWNDSVIEGVAPERLLVWDPSQGWEPLCRFLEVDVPDEPFPRANDTAAFKEGVIGGALRELNDWWDKRERPREGVHGAPVA